MPYRLLQSGSKAGNANADFVVPANKTWHLAYAELVLTTAANVANRRAIMRVLDDTGAEVVDYHAGMTVPASQTDQHHQFMQGTYRETSFIGGALQVPFGSEMVLPGWTLPFLIENGVAGDSFAVKPVVGED